MKGFFKRILFACVALVAALPSWAQLEPVKWSTSVDELETGLYRIVFTATVDAGWHIYDLGPYEMGGPMATSFEFTPDGAYTLDGGVYALAEAHREFDPIYEMEIGYYEGRAQFAQNVRCSDGAVIAVTADWMACNETNCVTGDNDFSIEVGKSAASASAPATDNSAKTAANESKVSAAAPASSGGSLWGYILSAIGWALVALLTPCVFPMIPMTVSFFLKGSGSAAAGRFRALMYGLFIVILYTVPIGIIILITWLVGGDVVTADIFNWLATHWLPNLIFFAVFMIFGSVLIQSTSGEFWTPIITMLAFSVVFALPFTLFALFPSWLKKLPKSGGWLNSVKVVLGFVELALGLKFLSVADQTYHWGILDREVYLALWIVIFSLLGLYLLGKLRFKHDSDMPYLSVTRLVLAIITFAFVVYMIPGMWGAPLKALSGYMPPMQTQDFVMTAGSGAAAPSSQSSAPETGVKYGDVLKLPLGLEGFFDLAEAEAYAAKVDKPLFVDFTGHGCVNCREMEARVWSDPRVLELLRNEYVIVALYADDKLKVDESDWVTTDTGKVLKTLGKINSYYALKTYGVNAQPYYVLQGRNGEPLVEPRGYDLDVDAFVQFLRSGVEAYRNNK